MKKRRKIRKIILKGMKTNTKEMKRLNTWNNNKYEEFFFHLDLPNTALGSEILL